MDRRHLLKLIASGMVGQALDLDKLLWMPGVKTIFIPELKRLSTSEIVAAELERLQPKVRKLFEADSELYSRITERELSVTSNREYIIPMRWKE